MRFSMAFSMFLSIATCLLVGGCSCFDTGQIADAQLVDIENTCIPCETQTQAVEECDSCKQNCQCGKCSNRRTHLGLLDRLRMMRNHNPQPLISRFRIHRGDCDICGQAESCDCNGATGSEAVATDDCGCDVAAPAAVPATPAYESTPTYSVPPSSTPTNTAPAYAPEEAEFQAPSSPNISTTRSFRTSVFADEIPGLRQKLPAFTELGSSQASDVRTPARPVTENQSQSRTPARHNYYNPKVESPTSSVQSQLSTEFKRANSTPSTELFMPPRKPSTKPANAPMPSELPLEPMADQPLDPLAQKMGEEVENLRKRLHTLDKATATDEILNQNSVAPGLADIPSPTDLPSATPPPRSFVNEEKPVSTIPRLTNEPTPDVATTKPNYSLPVKSVATDKTKLFLQGDDDKPSVDTSRFEPAKSVEPAPVSAPPAETQPVNTRAPENNDFSPTIKKTKEVLKTDSAAAPVKVAKPISPPNPAPKNESTELQPVAAEISPKEMAVPERAPMPTRYTPNRNITSIAANPLPIQQETEVQKQPAVEHTTPKAPPIAKKIEEEKPLVLKAIPNGNHRIFSNYAPRPKRQNFRNVSQQQLATQPNIPARRANFLPPPRRSLQPQNMAPQQNLQPRLQPQTGMQYQMQAQPQQAVQTQPQPPIQTQLQPPVQAQPPVQVQQTQSIDLPSAGSGFRSLPEIELPQLKEAAYVEPKFCTLRQESDRKKEQERLLDIQAIVKYEIDKRIKAGALVVPTEEMLPREPMMPITETVPIPAARKNLNSQMVPIQNREPTPIEPVAKTNEFDSQPMITEPVNSDFSVNNEARETYEFDANSYEPNYSTRNVPIVPVGSTTLSPVKKVRARVLVGGLTEQLDAPIRRPSIPIRVFNLENEQATDIPVSQASSNLFVPVLESGAQPVDRSEIGTIELNVESTPIPPEHNSSQLDIRRPEDTWNPSPTSSFQPQAYLNQEYSNSIPTVRQREAADAQTRAEQVQEILRLRAVSTPGYQDSAPPIVRFRKVSTQIRYFNPNDAPQNGSSQTNVAPINVTTRPSDIAPEDSRRARILTPGMPGEQEIQTIKARPVYTNEEAVREIRGLSELPSPTTSATIKVIDR